MSSKLATKKAKKTPKAKKHEAKKNGRPSEYTAQKATAICTLIAEGLSLRKACKSVQMSTVTVRNWLLQHPEFVKQYARAREEQADFYAEDIIEIADGEEMPDQKRVRIDARKWVACKLHPRVYGDKLDVTTRDESPPITREWMIDTMRKSPDFLAEVESMVAEAKR